MTLFLRHKFLHETRVLDNVKNTLTSKVSLMHVKSSTFSISLENCSTVNLKDKIYKIQLLLILTIFHTLH